jgi:hypothetical protein
MKAPAIDLDVTTVAIIAVAAVVGIVLLRKLPSAGEVWNGATDVAFHTADAAAGVLTGNNVITQTARTDAYQGAGVIGTLGAATDQVFGGTLSRFGEWLGGKTYDWTH